MSVTSMERLAIHEPISKPEDLREIIPYIVSIHGKFYDMTEIPGRPGCYEELCIDYENPIKVLKEKNEIMVTKAALKECGYDGYIDSEYEGQRDQQDRGYEFLPDETEQVRRHHEMLKRLIEG